MKCPTCGAAELKFQIRDMVLAYLGETEILPDISGEYCPACSEGILAPDDLERYNSEKTRFYNEVDVRIASAKSFARMREKLGLTQQAAAAAMDDDPNAFGRYESGESIPPLALVRLLRLLEAHPELLEEVIS
jgi:HTH-type transcriptional regulator / antitoxin MqsA